MRTIKCVGRNFAHSTSSTLNKIPKNFRWDFNISEIDSHDVFFIDQEIINAHLKFKPIRAYGWLLESRCLNKPAVDWIRANLDVCREFFIHIFTCDRELLDLDPLFHFLPAYGTYIDEFTDHEKTKLVSMVTSNKNFAPLHPFRNNFARNNHKSFDLYGRGYKEVEKKEEALNSYMFSVAIENDAYDYYYTEKLIDCFATKTVPIYLGSSDIKPFNEKGVIRLTKEFDFSLLSADLYQEYLPHIEENFETSKGFDCLDDRLFEIIKNENQ